ncbi:MAG TPA: phenylacetate--CoA ligase [Mycobacteriales bacterium]|nr:phenylacetate--CoA ligase [Mycobacteriales bacterium]
MFEPVAEGMSRDERAVLQERRLRGLVDRLLAVDGMQGRRLRAAGVTGGQDVTLADLPRLPTTAKADLWEAYPFGLLAVPREQVVVVHGSSGTGGRPTLVAYTRNDLALWAAMCARALAAAGGTEQSIVHNAYGYGLFTGGLGIHQGAVTLGATVVPLSGGFTQRQITMLRDLQPDILTCTPSYAVFLGEALRRDGVEIPSLRAGIFGAEPWSEGLRARIEELLPLKALDIYGLSEVIGPGVASECIEAQHGLHVNEDHFLVETLDPTTGQPTADGVPGELTFTTPTKEALPLLRYRTGDVATVDTGPCHCGRTLVRMSKVTGRVDDMVVIRGVNVYPSEIEAVLLGRPGVAPHYLVVVDRRTAATRLLVVCEVDGPPEPARAALGGQLQDRLGVRAEVVVVAPGTVPRVEVGKARRRVDWSAGEPPPLPGLA